VENFSLLFEGFKVASSFSNILAALFGAFCGILVGALPGLGSVTGVALLLPLTFKFNPTTAIIMLCALYFGNMFGGAFSAILVNIPGDSPAIMTALDGYELTKQGKASKALASAISASFIGGGVGIVILTFLGPTLARIGLKFGPAEMVSLLLFSLTSIGWLLGEDIKKGLVTTCLGFLIALIGQDPTRGQIRFTFGITELISGISFVPLVIGMFGFSQVINLMRDRQEFTLEERAGLSIKNAILPRKDLISILPESLKGGVLGSFIGVLPGAGATIASFISYIFNKRFSKDKANFGKGSINGIASAEAANNAAAAGAFAPLLSMGIPGSGTTAILLGGLLMWGLNPGPRLFTEAPDFTWGLIASMYISNVLAILIALLMIPFVVKILKLPISVLIPTILTLCVVGSYAVNNSLFDVGVMLIAGVIGYLIQEKGYSLAPLLLAFVLSPQLERSFVQALQISHGSFSIFFTKPISLAFLLLIVVSLVVPMVVKKIKANKQELQAN